MKKICTLFIAGFFALALLLPSSVNAATSSDYTVQAGDTMWKISQRFHVSYGALVKANPQIENPSLIYVGQTVHIPAANDGDYYVQRGDTMWKISQKFGVSYSSLLKANPQIENPSLIYVGQVVHIPQGSSSGESDSYTLNAYEQKVVELTNKERTSRGLPALKVSAKLSKMARIKAADMRDNHYFSHTSPTYGSPFEMMKKFGISYTYAGENIAAGQPTPQEVVNAWMNSSGHRANILNSHYTYIGVGYVKGGSYGSYWTQEFIRN
ncbi:MAG TPA: LysM peptidoglycan-binding domain-containing protein [Bacillales bacterium]|nr:LysM peptidoglycan-binding domain-containing protein [Bacillales bacterium]